MRVRARLGLAALGTYLASVGTVLAFGVGGEFPARWSRDLAWGLSMSAAVGVAAVVSGVCLVLAATAQAFGPAAAEPDRGGSSDEPGAAGSRSTADRRYDANRRTWDDSEPVRRSSVRENRGRSSAMGPGSAKEVHALSEVAAPRRGPGPAAAEAGSGAGVSAAEQKSECPGGVGAGRGGVGQNAGDLPVPAVLGPDALIRCWRRYRDEGDGHFRADGLCAELTESGFAMEVFEGRDLGAGDDVLIVSTGAPDGTCYLVPSFAKSPGAVGNWFEDRGDRSLSRRVNDLAELAEGRRTADGIVQVRKGVVS